MMLEMLAYSRIVGDDTATAENRGYFDTGQKANFTEWPDGAAAA
jgi:hypothetical protein